jgi:recombination protein RecA
LGSKKRNRLDFVVKQLQRQFGSQALRRGDQAFEHRQKSAIATGFADLDAALDGIGGIPRGHLTEILSAQTAGVATLALKVIAQAQAQGGLATYVDLAETFDPDYAARCGVQLARSQFLLVSPATMVEALEIIHALIAHRSSRVVVLDAVSPLLVDPGEAAGIATALRQLPPVLAKSDCALIFLTLLESSTPKTITYPPGFDALPHVTGLRILLHKERWLINHNDIRGYESRALVLTNKLGQAGHSARLAITFNGVVEGDGT